MVNNMNKFLIVETYDGKHLAINIDTILSFKETEIGGDYKGSKTIIEVENNASYLVKEDFHEIVARINRFYVR